MSERIVTGAELVPLNTLTLHPKNPNQGNVPAIMESLEANGQYLPVLVHRSTRHIIAGNSTVKAARKLGWSNISVNWFEGSDAEALALCLEDNKTADAATIDEGAAYAIASSLPDLTGTGYTLEDLTPPEVDLSAYEPADDPAAAPEPAGESSGGDNGVPLRLGPLRGSITNDAYDSWRSHFPKRRSEALAEVLMLLGLVVPYSPAPERSDAARVEKVPLQELKQYPGNPNHGDLGLLMAMLTQWGQTRPVVVSRGTRYILRGNHVVQAAAKLGWEEIGVSWIDTDADGEKRILLADNRLRQLATFNLDALGAAIAEVGGQGIESTGYTLGDLDDILAGRSPKMAAWTKAEQQLVIGDLKAKVRTELVRDLNLTPGQELQEMVSILGMDPSCVTT